MGRSGARDSVTRSKTAVCAHVAPEIDDLERIAPHYPALMAPREPPDITRAVFGLFSVSRSYAETTGNDVKGVLNLTAGSARLGFQVRFPAPARAVGVPANAKIIEVDDVYTQVVKGSRLLGLVKAFPKGAQGW
jgi:hypothetical protein